MDSSTIEYIINKFTDNEDGVRNIKRKIEDIFLKINLLRLIDNNQKDNKINIEYKIDNLVFPLNIDNNIVNNLLLVK